MVWLEGCGVRRRSLPGRPPSTVAVLRSRHAVVVVVDTSRLYWILQKHRSNRVVFLRVDPMIGRIWHGWTKPENADKYERLLKEEVFPGIADKKVPGYRGIQLFRRPIDDNDETEFVTIKIGRASCRERV